MSDKKLAALGILAVIMAGWAILQNRVSQRANEVDLTSSILIEGLDIDAVSTIKITAGQGQTTTTLNRKGSGFIVENKDGEIGLWCDNGEIFT